jgi:hypothetical protein
VALRDSSGNLTATRFIGVTDRSDRLKIDNAAVDTDPNYRSAKTTKTANTIAARDGSGNLLANTFDGTATAAQYADLAEKYLADKTYDIGTVVCIGGEKEITAATYGDRAIGIVSGKPGFIMNSHLEGGTLVALKGRVPVKVQGKVKKGEATEAAGAISAGGYETGLFTEPKKVDMFKDEQPKTRVKGGFVYESDDKWSMENLSEAERLDNMKFWLIVSSSGVISPRK